MNNKKAKKFLLSFFFVANNAYVFVSVCKEGKRF